MRTNKLYEVRVCLCDYMIVEADNPQEAIALAKKNLNGITIENFVGSDPYIDACDKNASDIEFVSYDDRDKVYTNDGVMTAKEYKEQLKNQ